MVGTGTNSVDVSGPRHLLSDDNTKIFMQRGTLNRKIVHSIFDRRHTTLH